MNQLPEIRCFDTRFHPLTMEETIAAIDARLTAGYFTEHVVLNTAKIISMRDDQRLRSAVSECDLINADGMGVVWGARLLGFQVPERVAGIDVFTNLLALSASRNWPVFFLGATEDVLQELAAQCSRRYPALLIAGMNHGYFWPNEAEVVEKIRSSGAKLLFVAMSSPLKEIFISKWKEKFGVNFVMGVGGSFDVLAGKIKRAPIWMQKCGLEWSFRVMQEPRRMWKRYATTNTAFLVLLWKEKWSRFRRRRIE